MLDADRGLRSDVMANSHRQAPKYGKRSIAAKREKAEASGSVYPYPKAKKTAYDADAEKGLSTFGL